ncbi:MAG: C4-dicarboxylate ABC transporter, partial [Rubrivivax sp.]
SVAAKKDYKDRVTGELIPAVTTAQIYKGSIAFICIQLFMVLMVVLNPGLVSDNLDKNTTNIDADAALEKLNAGRQALQDMSPGAAASAAEEDDPMKRMLEQMKDEPKK